MKWLSLILSVPFAIGMYGILLIFQPIQWLGLKLFGKKVHQTIVNIMNACICACLLILFNRIRFSGWDQNLPGNKPIIFVANHQSMFDISPIGWRYRKHHITYISKKELAMGIPSVSFNLKYGDSVAIDRNNPEQAHGQITRLAKTLRKENRGVLLFPEGTRSRDGKPGVFKRKGLSYLLEIIPDSLIVPISIRNSWKIFRYGSFPFGIMNLLDFYVHTPRTLDQYPDFDHMFEELEKDISSKAG